MSNVTNVILSLGDNNIRESETALTCLEEWCTHNSMCMNMHTIDGVSGGSKHMEVDVYCWGANHMDREAFMRAVAACDWEYPQTVQLMLKGEDDLRWDIFDLTLEKTWVNHQNDSLLSRTVL